MQKVWLTPSVLAIGMASLLSDVSHEMATTILPAFLALEIQASPFTLGMIEGVADGLATYFKLIGGWMTDRLGRRKPIAAAGYALTAVATAGFAFAFSAVTVLFCRSLAWMARGWRSPARNALLADSVRPHDYGRVFGFERAMDTIGAVIAPVVALGLIEAGFGHRDIFLITLLPGLLAFVAVAGFVHEVPRTHGPSRTLWGDLTSLPRSFHFFLIIAGVFGLGQFAPTLLILRATELTGSPKTAMGLYVFFNIVQAGAAYGMGHMSHRLGTVSLLGVSYFCFGLAAFGFAFSGPNMSELTVLFALAGLAFGGIEAMEPTVAAELLPASVRGTGFGVLAAANGVGDFFSSVLVGALWATAGATVGFGVAAMCSSFSFLVLLVWAKQRGQPAVI